MSGAEDIVIVAARRTAMGSFLGMFKDVSAVELGVAAAKAVIADAGLGKDDVQKVIIGNVLGAGQGQAPGRQVTIKSGLSNHTAAITLNRMCGSGMQAVMEGANFLRLHQGDVVMAGGIESMTNAPYLLPKGRGGYRMGHGKILDHMMWDGLEDAFEPGRAMGTFADATAAKYGFTREEQDAFALESLARATKAIEDGSFADEIVPVEVPKKGEMAVDELPGRARPEKIPNLRPAFNKDGTVTAANSSGISDGAAALVLMRRETAEKRGLKPLATLLGYTDHSQEPEWFTTAPVGAIRTLLDQQGWKPADVDLWEINEAFAVVTMAAMRDINIPFEKVNIHGGATALGHPIGASGARLIVTLIHALAKRGGGKGVATLCIGGGEATAVAIDVPAA